MPSKKILLIEQRNSVAIVTLNRPEAMNALSRMLRSKLAREIRRLDSDPYVRVIILTGTGYRAFSAGLDLKELGTDPAALGSAGKERSEDDPLDAIEACHCPVIGAVNGVAVTGGFELALGCDILLASPNARFADTHVRVGVLPGWGLSQKLARIIGPSRARELSFTGRFIDAAQAEEWGLVSRIVPQASLLQEAVILADEIAKADPIFLRELKQLINDGLGSTLADGRRLERHRAKAWNAGLTPDALEARRASVIMRGRSENTS